MNKDSSESSKVNEYEALFNTVNDAVVVHYFDKKGNPSNFIAVNDITCKRYGYSREELLKMSPAQIDDPEAFKKYAIPAIKKLARDGKVTFETVHLTKTRQKIPVEVNATTFYVNGRKAMLSVARDITERKIAEEKVRESSELLNTLSNNLPGFIAYVNARTLKYEYANEAYQKYFGIPLNKITGTHIKNVIGNAAYKFALKYIKQVRQGKSTSYENVINLKEGKRWIKVNYVPGFDLEGEVVSIIVMSYDITEQRKATNAIKESEEKFRMFFKSIPVSIYTWQKKGDDLVLVDYNTMALTSTKGAIKKLIGIKLNSMYKDTSSQNRQIKIYMKRCLREKKVIEKDMEYQLQTSHENKFLHVKYAYVPPNFVMVHTEDITERKKAEETLKASETKYKYIFNNSAIGMYRTRLDGSEVIEFNDKYCSILGVTRKDVISKPSKILWAHPKERLKMVKLLESKGRVDELEFQLKRKDGMIIDCITSVMLYPEQGILEGSIVDITEKKLIEEQLKESEFFFRESQNAAMIGSYKTDFVLDKWKSSEVLDQIFGIDKNYNRNIKGWLDFVHPVDKAMMDKYLREEVIAKQKSFSKEYRIIHKSDGEARWVNGLGKMSFDAKGNPLTMIGTIQDITERKKAEEEIVNAKILLQGIINLLPIRIFWKDRKLNYLGCNTMFAKDAGKYTPEELVGKNDLQMVWKEQAKAYRADDQKTMKLGESKLNYEEEQTTPKGNKIWLKTSKMPLIDSEGNTIGVLGTYEDITERKNAEEKIRQEQGINNAIINSIPGAFYMLDKNGKYVRWNAYQRDEIIGKSEDQIAKIKAIDTIHPDDKKLVQSKIENVLANGKVETVEGRILLHGGPAFRWLLMTGQQTVIDGNPFLVGIGMDITERKKIEEDLKASQNVLQEKIIDLERFNRISVDRELRMIELKQKIKELEEKLGKK